MDSISDLKENPCGAAHRFNRDGVLALWRCLDPSLALKVAEDVDQQLAAAEKDAGSMAFGRINGSKLRRDLVLVCTPRVVQALVEVCAKLSKQPCRFRQ